MKLEYQGLEKRYEAMKASNDDLIGEKSSLEAVLSQLKSRISDLEQKLERQDRELNQLRMDKQILKEEIRKEFRDELRMKDVAFESLHDRYGSVQEELEKEKSNHKKSISELAKSKVHLETQESTIVLMTQFDNRTRRLKVWNQL